MEAAFSRLSLSPSKAPYSVGAAIASFRSKAEITSLRSEGLAVPFFRSTLDNLEPPNERVTWIKREENGDDNHYSPCRLPEREQIQRPLVESSRHFNKMAIPPGKTPISYLQELCTKRGVTPQYDLIANEGAIHEPTFLMRVTVGETIATGKGSSKKKAKHAAAQNALNQILGLQNGGGDSEDAADSEGSFCPNKPTKDENSNEDGQNVNGDDCGGEGNPVGELQEFTQKKLIKPPVYEFTSEQGPPHNREFVCTVKLGKDCEKATGRSKKAAKRAAALAMLQHIKKLNALEGDNAAQAEDSEEEEDIPLGFEPKSSYSRLKDGGGRKLPPPTPQQAQEIQRFYERIVKINSQSGSGDGTTSMATNYCKMLQEIAEVQRFEVTYSDLNDLSANGFRACLVTLSTTPCAVVHGTGETTDEAHGNAAHMALQYLKMQYQKKMSST